MLKKLALTAPTFVLGTSLALAQGTTMNQPSMNQPSSRSSAATSPSSVSEQKLAASDIYKTNVYNNSDNKIGDVRDLLIHQSDGKITTVIIGVGGFLGVGQKDVAIPFQDLKVSSRDGKVWLVLDQTKDQLKSVPAYTGREQHPEQTTGRSVARPSSSLTTQEWLISDIYRADVYDYSDQKIGKITDLMMDRNGQLTDVAINVGDFLGTGKKEVGIPFKELKVVSREGKDWLVLNRTKDDVIKAPVFDKSATNRMSDHRRADADQLIQQPRATAGFA